MKSAPEVLDYSVGPTKRWRLIDRAVPALIGLCIIGAFLCGWSAKGHVGDPHYTPQFLAWARAEQAKKNLDPDGYVEPRYVGTRIYRDQLWQLPSTYGALAFSAAAIGLFAYGFRARRSGSAG
jgi:hypothetical protein